MADDKIERVKSAIKATKMPQRPKNKLEEILCDADLSHLGSQDFFEVSASLRREWHALGEEELSDEEWIKQNLDFLRQHEYFTAYGKETFSERKAKNLKKRVSSYFLKYTYKANIFKMIYVSVLFCALFYLRDLSTG